jgi:anti-sigma factor RsiW
VNHADIKKHLAEYLEGDLPIGDRALVDAHLDACDSCAGEVEEMLQTIRLLRTMPEPETPPMITANVMRRIRSGEGQLGFFGRIRRTLGGVLEPGFVLPASAIAAAALVVTVVQSFGGIPGFDGTHDSRDGSEERYSLDRTESSVASLPASIAADRRGEQRARALRARRASGASNEMDFVARVERRASQSDRTLRIGPVQGMPLIAAGSGTRIQIKLEGLGLAEESTPQPSRAHQISPPSGGRLFTSRSPDGWTTDLSNRISQNSSDSTSPGTLVTAERLGTGDFTTRSGVWPQTVSQRDFLTSVGIGATEQSDPRDAWLALGFEDPAEFARYIAGRNLAEQELWAARLSERAEARGLLGDLLEALRASGDPTAAWVADDFSAQAERAGSSISEAEDQFSR